MPSCSAFNCTNGSRCSKQKMRLFRFPLKDKKRLAQWVAKVSRKNWVPNSNSRLCAVHFAEECFLVKGGKQSLTPSAVPTIFDYSLKSLLVSAPKSPRYASAALITGKDHTYATRFQNMDLTEDFHTSRDMSSNHEPQNLPPTETAVASKPTSQVHIQDTTLDRSAISQEHYYCISTSPMSNKRKVKTQLEHCRKRLRVQKQKTKRWKKKMDSLSAGIEELKDKNLISTGCSEMMASSFSGVTKEIITRMEKGIKSKVSEELRSFALTLHYGLPSS